MGVLVYVLGRSGTGKSYSLRNFTPDEIGIVNVQGKILPFKGKYDMVNTDNSVSIVAAVKRYASKYKTVVVDDFQYVMANEFMRRATERGYDKFTEIARHAWDIADCVRSLPAEIIVYVLCHTDTDADGFEKLKTIGRFLDEKIVLEGMSTIVLKTAVSDGQYMFLTQNNGKDTVKSPAGMFPTYAIDNDLKYVDEKIRSYYELGDFKTDLTDYDDAVAKPDVQKEEKKKRGRKAEKEGTEDAPKEEAKEKAKRSRRKVKDTDTDSTHSNKSVTESLAEERKAVQEQNELSVATNNGEITEDTPDELKDFDMNEPDPVVEEIPKRKKRTRDISKVKAVEEHVEEPSETPAEASVSASEEPKRRRRRKV